MLMAQRQVRNMDAIVQPVGIPDFSALRAFMEKDLMHVGRVMMSDAQTSTRSLVKKHACLSLNIQKCGEREEGWYSFVAGQSLAHRGTLT